MMSLTIKHHSGKALSVLQTAESAASRLEATHSLQVMTGQNPQYM